MTCLSHSLLCGYSVVEIAAPFTCAIQFKILRTPCRRQHSFFSWPSCPASASVPSTLESDHIPVEIPDRLTCAILFRNTKTTMSKAALIFLLVIVPCFCQRPFYAGIRPIGFPNTPVTPGKFTKFSNLPIPAQLNGDRDYADRLDALPKDKQPFFFLNKEHVAANLANPQTYPLRPSSFNENSNRV
ncbi:hypothetical protein PYW08_004954 [Mythimna loreyi]|uniref:Uncharacterized protein n=1 Tax=Mythimna loreyi TaxID=667449 RepID=A0ACC2QE95_9NEOP|nr:hypothetical protein PYW08_004954 [Mythimna loreyi]